MLLVVPDLAAFLGIDAAAPRLHDALVAAEATVAAHLGAPTLEARTIEVAIRIERGQARVVHLADGPATALSGVELDGTVLTDVAIYGFWALRRTSGLLFSGTTVEATYTAGWTRQLLPPPVRQALLLVAASLHARADLTVTSERTAGASFDYSAGLPSAALAMLAPYRRPFLG
jgi:hypothetical protein